jgi:molecular chaperone GrpE (heat shock protein)
MNTPGEIMLTDEFASAMQQLSAEAEKTLPSDSWEEKNGPDRQFDQLIGEIRALHGRIESFETSMANRLERLEKEKPSDLAAQLQSMDGHISALRNTETVNQRLFDSLHDELIKYRDNFLHESLQKPFIRDLLNLFDDLSGLSSQLLTAGEGADPTRATLGRWHENLENSIHSLTEILHRMEVNEIEQKDIVDRAIHRVVSFEPANYAEEEGQIVMRVKRGFLWRDQVLRPEEVVAKRFV